MKIQDKVIIIGEKQIIFEYPIKKTLVINEEIFVILEVPEDVVYNENVFSINKKSELQWQIPSKRYNKTNCPFTDIYKCDENLGLYNRCGVEIIINPISKEIIAEDLIK